MCKIFMKAVSFVLIMFVTICYCNASNYSYAYNECEIELLSSKIIKNERTNATSYQIIGDVKVPSKSRSFVIVYIKEPNDEWVNYAGYKTSNIGSDEVWHFDIEKQYTNILEINATVSFYIKYLYEGGESINDNNTTLFNLYF